LKGTGASSAAALKSYHLAVTNRQPFGSQALVAQGSGGIALAHAWIVPFGPAFLAAFLVVEAPTAPPPVAEPAPQQSAAAWYGAPAAVADGLSLVLMGSAWGTKQEALLFLGGAGYLLGGPIGHLANGRGERAAGSLGLRMVATGIAAGAVLADFYLSRGCDPDGGPPCGAPVGGLVAGGAVMLGVAILDDVWLARGPAASPPACAALMPSLVVTSRLGLVSFAGRF
jgi:hypothetical protein